MLWVRSVFVRAAGASPAHVRHILPAKAEESHREEEKSEREIAERDRAEGGAAWGGLWFYLHLQPSSHK